MLESGSKMDPFKRQNGWSAPIRCPLHRHLISKDVFEESKASPVAAWRL